ncbi:hypothetical protein C8R46DRAFT_1211126 [Mycena filopes]|nr:hypothetical protein C8R46DRAFT_1211126 [Mycena filopes]
MPGLPDTSLPILTAPLSPATAAKILLTIIGLVLFALSVRYASPAHQTGILSATMASLDKVFGDVASAGFSSVPPQDIPSTLSAYDNISLLYGVLHLHGSMQGLRVQVGSLREERLQNSRAWSATLCEFLRGRSITLYCCIRKAKDLETRLKIFQEKQRNAAFSSAVSQSTGTAHLRRGPLCTCYLSAVLLLSNY